MPAHGLGGGSDASGVAFCFVFFLLQLALSSWIFYAKLTAGALAVRLQVASVQFSFEEESTDAVAKSLS